MYRNDTFSFSGVPESIDINRVGEGFKTILKCKNVKFNIANLSGLFDECEIYYFTSKQEIAECLNRELFIEGIIGAADNNNKRSLIALKLK